MKDFQTPVPSPEVDENAGAGSLEMVRNDGDGTAGRVGTQGGRGGRGGRRRRPFGGHPFLNFLNSTPHPVRSHGVPARSFVREASID